ncbi:hypothetical protein GALMADRAFT_209807 [Galerina marginata CBS 339.88]|uniref:Uncharacterized protein n=1 Tax=Galerina marginata (strain CBS 339.88) TaxID=685588 RepID=A0A067T2X4_GALM3|nr:hypothetical protein GALMADRAFT_209807 [Galerina marginata CBS 339.88]
MKTAVWVTAYAFLGVRASRRAYYPGENESEDDGSAPVPKEGGGVDALSDVKDVKSDEVGAPPSSPTVMKGAACEGQRQARCCCHYQWATSSAGPYRGSVFVIDVGFLLATVKSVSPKFSLPSTYCLKMVDLSECATASLRKTRVLTRNNFPSAPKVSQIEETFSKIKLFVWRHQDYYLNTRDWYDAPVAADPGSRAVRGEKKLTWFGRSMFWSNSSPGNLVDEWASTNGTVVAGDHEHLESFMTKRAIARRHIVCSFMSDVRRLSQPSVHDVITRGQGRRCGGGGEGMGLVVKTDLDMYDKVEKRDEWFGSTMGLRCTVGFKTMFRAKKQQWRQAALIDLTQSHRCGGTVMVANRGGLEDWAGIWINVVRQGGVVDRYLQHRSTEYGTLGKAGIGRVGQRRVELPSSSSQRWPFCHTLASAQLIVPFRTNDLKTC